MNAKIFAAWVWKVDLGRVLGASYLPDGGHVCVIDNGIAGAPKYVLTAVEVADTNARWERQEGDELRGVFGSDGVAVFDMSAPIVESGGVVGEKKKRTKRAVKNASHTGTI